jgi:hypothetical protein
MKALRRLLVVVAAVALPLVTLAQEAPKPPVISWYGILHGGFFFNGGTFNAQDAAYQGLRTNSGGSTYFSARQSRAGMKLNLGDDNAFGAAITGVLEFDFMGSNTATNSTGAYNPNVRLRHAAMTAGWKTGFGDLSLLVGQEWDVLLNLNPDSIAYLANPMFGQSGNVFRRAPQIRLSWASSMGDLGFGVQALAMSPVDSVSASVDNGLGNQARSPNLEGRVYVSMKGDIGGTIGVGFETEKRRISYDAAAGTKVDVTTSLFGIDADLNLTKFAQVKGEYFKDNGMADAMAGMTANTTVKTLAITGTGATAVGHVVKSDGYWAQAILKPIPLLFVTVGMGQSKIDVPSLTAAKGNVAPAAGDRTKNASTSVGLIMNVSKAWKLGLDYYMTTSTYGDGANKNEVKIQQVALASQLRF